MRKKLIKKIVEYQYRTERELYNQTMSLDIQDKTLFSKSELFYDEHGHLVEQDIYDEIDGQLHLNERYEYVYQNLNLTIYRHYRNTAYHKHPINLVINGHIEYFYSTQNIRIEEVNILEHSRTHYEISSSNEKIGAQIYYRGDLVEKHEYQTNQLGQQIAKKVFRVTSASPKPKLILETRYEYDKYGKLQREKATNFEVSHHHRGRFNLLTYIRDENEDLIEHSRKGVVDQDCKYYYHDYDINGNWKLSSEFLNGTRIYLFKRDIEYF